MSECVWVSSNFYTQFCAHHGIDYYHPPIPSFRNRNCQQKIRGDSNFDYFVAAMILSAIAGSVSATTSILPKTSSTSPSCSVQNAPRYLKNGQSIIRHHLDYTILTLLSAPPMCPTMADQYLINRKTTRNLTKWAAANHGVESPSLPSIFNEGL